jgi:magnesium chelatase family protein
VLKVARTIADLDGAHGVARVHAAEALTYRYRPAAQPSMPARSKGPHSLNA